MLCWHTKHNYHTKHSYLRRDVEAVNDDENDEDVQFRNRNKVSENVICLFMFKLLPR